MCTIDRTPARIHFFHFVITRRLFCSLFLVLIAGSFARGAEELLPPFGFRWRDPASRVEAILKGAKAEIVSREKKENREVWTVEGLIHPGLKRTLFTFKGGLLTDVELQYEYPNWTIERYNDRMGDIRRFFDTKYGVGKLVARPQHDTDSNPEVIQTLVGYQWVIGATMLELFYFSASEGHVPADRDPYPPVRVISVSYKAL
ncbi:MAG TPA: hypothetical protein VEI58_06630 [Chthoniobacterales bacterium]|nr:hypothetical protein [Chthoniobacterales bacterium]